MVVCFNKKIIDLSKVESIEDLGDRVCVSFISSKVEIFPSPSSDGDAQVTAMRYWGEKIGVVNLGHYYSSVIRNTQKENFLKIYLEVSKQRDIIQI